MNKGIYKYISVFFLYFIFALVFTWPLVLNMNNFIAGNPLGEMWSHVWGMHWLKTGYLQHGAFPFHTDSLNYPYGGDIFFIDPLNGLLSIPVQMIASLCFTYNFLLILNLAFGAFACFLLSDYFLRNRYAAFYSGAAYSFSAYYLSVVSTGTSEAFNIGWIPMFLLLLCKTLREKKLIFAVYAGIVLFITVFSNFYYAEFTLMFTVFGLLYYLLTRFYRIVMRDLIHETHISRFFKSFRKSLKKKEGNGESIGKLSLKRFHDLINFFTHTKDRDAIFQYLLILAYRGLLIINFLFSLTIVVFIRRRLLNPNINKTAFYFEVILSLILFSFFLWALWKEFTKKGKHNGISSPEEEKNNKTLSEQLILITRSSSLKEKWRNFVRKLFIFSKLILTRILPRLALIAITAGIFILPYMYIFETYMKSPDSMLRSRGSIKVGEKKTLNENFYSARNFSDLNIYHANSIYLQNYLAIGKNNIYRRYSLQHNFMSTFSSYLGFITLFLCLIALLKSKKRGVFYFWFFSGLIFLILSLGPFCRYTAFQSLYRFTLPYRLFYQNFPFFVNIRIPQRFGLCVLLSQGIIAGGGIAYLVEGMKKLNKSLLTIIISLAMLMEIIILSPAPFPLELNKLDVPDIYFQMAKENADYGVIECPIKKFRQGLYYQTVHEKGSILSVNDFIPDLVSGNLFVHCIYSLERGFEVSPYVYSEEHLQNFRRKLKEARIRYIVVYNDLLGNREADVNRFLEHFLGKPQKLRSNVNVYQVFSD